MSFTLDPHPLGCPLSLSVTPSEMTDLVSRIYLQVRDLLHLSVHVIHPRRGDPYPILNLYEDDVAEVPRVVCFPWWEDDQASPRRRLGYTRQVQLIQRIADAGVEGEDLESYRGVTGGMNPQPLQLSLGHPEAQLDGVLIDLDAKLGDLVRLTLTRVEHPKGQVSAIRLYGPVDEGAARVVMWPGWFGAAEGAAQRIDKEVRAALWERIRQGEGREIPLEAIIQGL